MFNNRQSEYEGYQDVEELNDFTIRRDFEDAAYVLSQLDIAKEKHLQCEVMVWFIKYLREGNGEVDAIDGAMAEWDK